MGVEQHIRDRMFWKTQVESALLESLRETPQSIVSRGGQRKTDRARQDPRPAGQGHSLSHLNPRL